MRFAILGANGQLGSEIKNIFKKNNISILPFTREECDITSTESVKKIFEKYDFDVLINCAAFTNVPLAEDIKKEEAQLINSNCLFFLSEQCLMKNIHLIHFSTDFVFDGTSKIPYSEEDTTNPVNNYGRTKLSGESIIKEVLGKSELYTIFRIQWLYGNSFNNFFSKIKSVIDTKKEVTLVSDEIGSPCSVKFISDVLTNLAKPEVLLKLKGDIFHLTHDNYCSRFECGKYFLEKLGYKSNNIHSIRDLPSGNLIRPKFGAMCNNKLKEKLGISSLGSWESDIDVFISSCYSSENDYRKELSNN